jgi:thiamine pyrophosphate-dependent acetolactate synthase large subunit-like protein
MMSKIRISTRTVAEGFLAALKRRGIDYLFANAGTDFAAIVEAISTPGKAGPTHPRRLRSGGFTANTGAVSVSP